MTGLVLGFSFHLLLIPLAARRPSYLVEAPVDLAGWWSYVTLEVKGGGFLVNLFPRAADFVGFQLMDYLGFLSRNLSPSLLLPAALASLGWLVTVRGHPRRALGWLVLFLCAGVGAVIYFNLPRNYMRSIDRHYLPSLVILAPWVGVGATALLRAVAVGRIGRWLAPAAGLILMFAPLAGWRANRAACDLSRVRFAEGFARDLLEPLPQDAILLTNGDNDTLPLWYLQQVEGIRPDVAVINLSLTNTGEFVAGLRRRHPDLAGLLEGEPERGVLKPRMVADTTVATAVEPRVGLGLPEAVAAPDSVTFHIREMLLAQDRVLLDILRLTRWRRPVLIAITVTPDQLSWIWPYARLDGLTYRIIPSDDPAVWDVEHLSEQLLERVPYRAFADSTVLMDKDTRMLSRNYVAALFQLTSAQLQRGQARQALVTLQFLDQRVPLARLGATADIAEYRSRLEAEALRGAAATDEVSLPLSSGVK
jgi:hypothetical protein